MTNLLNTGAKVQLFPQTRKNILSLIRNMRGVQSGEKCEELTPRVFWNFMFQGSGFGKM